MKGLRVVVVTDSEHGHVLAARLRRMEVAQVMAVTGLEEARLLCQLGRADACLVAVGTPVPDAPPMKEGDAPGLCCSVPALMIAPVVTPQLRRAARRRGYFTAISATIPRRGCSIAALAPPFRAVTPRVESRAGSPGASPWPTVQIQPLSASRPCIDGSFQLGSFGLQP